MYLGEREGERGKDVLLDEAPGGLGVAEVDVARGGEEVREDDPCQPLGQLRGALGADVRREPRRQEDGRGVEDAGQPVQGHVGEHLAGLRRQHQLQVFVGTQGLCRSHDPADEQILVAVGAGQMGVEVGEELAALALAQRLIDVVLATGEQAVDGRPRGPSLGGDVLDRDLGHPPALAARLHRVEDAVLEGEVDDNPGVRHR